MKELHTKAKDNPEVAAVCLGAFVRGEQSDDSTTARARARVGGVLIAEAFRDLRAIREGLSKANG